MVGCLRTIELVGVMAFVQQMPQRHRPVNFGAAGLDGLCQSGARLAGYSRKGAQRFCRVSSFEKV